MLKLVGILNYLKHIIFNYNDENSRLNLNIIQNNLQILLLKYRKLI